ncbi:MAG: hypothetical protein QG671_2983, partial [Actinomycetota bacterium]|nr:hypothetical protein [Actinomycetota bacterium]
MRNHPSERSLPTSVDVHPPTQSRGLIRGSRVRSVACAVALAVVAGLGGAAPSFAADSSQAAVQADWDPKTVAPLSVDAAGGPVPTYTKAEVTPTQGLAVSLRPTLRVPTAPAEGQYRFTVMTVGAKDAPIWSATSSRNSIVVSPNVLKEGQTYVWQATAATGGEKFGPFAMLVDTRRSEVQPAEDIGPFHVSLASGTVELAVSPRKITGASGALGVNLSYRNGQAAGPGLPQGWTMSAEGQAWSHLQVNPGGSVGLVSPTGSAIAYQPAKDAGSYTPISPAGRPAPTGTTPTLVKNADESWTATMASGMVATFDRVNDDGKAFVKETFNGTAPGPRYELADGRITAVRDSVSPSLAMTLDYAGRGSCPDTPEGFVEPPAGMLCQIHYPDKTSTSFLYRRDTGGTVQLARIVDNPGTSESKSTVTDLGFDRSGRLASYRSGLGAEVLAAGVRHDSEGVLSTIDYDSAGRVARVSKPAASEGAPRPSYSISYSPEAGRTTVTAAGQQTTTGFTTRYTFDPVTLLPLSTTDSKGRTVQKEWDRATDLPLKTVGPTGLTTAHEYDDQQNLTATVGPFPASQGPSQATPRQDFRYDEDLSGAAPKAMHGLKTTYWTNDKLQGTPHGKDFGPRLGGGTIPGSLQWTWPSSPVGGTNPWSVRLEGVVTVPGNSGDAAQDYGFRVAPAGAATLWVDRVACPAAGCDLPLRPGPHTIRIDYRVSTPGSGGSSGIKVDWHTPGAQGFVPVPMAAVTPGYGLRTTTAQTDALSASAAVKSEAHTQFGRPEDGKPTAAWLGQTPTLKGTSRYEQFDPTRGQFGRQTATVMPAGNETTYDYYGPDESVTVPCTRLGEVNQHGLPKSTRRSTTAGNDQGDGVQTYINFYDSMGRVAASGINGAAASCTYRNDAGEVARTTTPARGSQPASSSVVTARADGNPLKTRATVKVDGGPTYTTEQEVDLYGRTVRTTDVWGTTETTNYDPISGQELSSTVTTKSGFRSTTATTYSQDGDPEKLLLDGKVLAVVGTPNAAGNTVDYGNGVRLVGRNNTQGAFSSQTWTTPDGKPFSYAQAKAPSGRTLGESFAFGKDSPDATFGYSYDANGRLVGAELDTDLAVAHHSWAYEFSSDGASGGNPKAGRNGNRTRQVVDGSQVSQYGYNTHDQLTESTDPAIGKDIEYSGWGEMTRLGALKLAYDGDSQVVDMADTTTGERTSYKRVAGTVIEKVKTTATGPATTSRYTSGGIILDADNHPQWQTLGLPGGATLLRNLGTGGQEWNFQTVRGQLLWSADGTGHDLGRRHLYSPFGEELIAAAKTPAPAKPKAPTAAKAPAKSKTPAPAKPAAKSKAPAAAKPTAAKPTATSTVAPPAYLWQAGNGLETEHLGADDLIVMGARLYVPKLGRFTSPDPVNQ